MATKGSALFSEFALVTNQIHLLLLEPNSRIVDLEQQARHKGVPTGHIFLLILNLQFCSYLDQRMLHSKTGSDLTFSLQQHFS